MFLAHNAGINMTGFFYWSMAVAQLAVWSLFVTARGAK
jgi:hypothetical protein